MHRSADGLQRRASECCVLCVLQQQQQDLCKGGWPVEALVCRLLCL